MQAEITTAEDRRTPEADFYVYEARHHAPAHKRLLGFIRYRIRRNPGAIWHRLLEDKFCELTGLSPRTYRRALERIRQESEDHGLDFRTVFKRDNGARGSWTVLVADTRQLLFDGEPLFRDVDNKPRHVRRHLRAPRIRPPERRQEAETTPDLARNHPPATTLPLKRITGPPTAEVTDTRILGGKPADHRINTPGGESGGQAPRKRPPWRRQPITPAGLARLERKAHWISRHRLRPLHWDNCRIDYHHQAVFGFVLRCLRGGCRQDRIEWAYDQALHRAHGFAVDLEASHGAFTLASTFSHAYALLRDGRTVGERVAGFYDRRRREVARIREALEDLSPVDC